jgi:hypothetical protein
MNKTAYLVGFIDKMTRRVLSADIFSEATPTTATPRLFATTLASFTGRDYHEARLVVADMVRESPHLSWVRPILTSRLPRTRRRVGK